KMFLVLSLHNGESFQNLKEENSSMISRDPVSYQRETFEYREFLIEFDANFERTDESLLQNQYIGKNLQDLQSSIDSMATTLDSINTINAKSIYDQSYKKTLTYPVDDSNNTQLAENQVAKTSSLVLNFDSIFNSQELSTKAALLTRAKSASENTRSEYYFRAATLGDEAGKYRRHITEWHKKFTLSFACLVFFFIGAPLGAIIRKGGLGMPVVISVLLFIFYYIIDNIGFKMAREGVWAAWQGMWLSSFVLAPLGIFLTYKAVNDSVILNADTYLNALKNLFGKRSGRKVEKKEVIIFTPDYEALLPRLELLATNCDNYLLTNKRWVNYLQYWKNGGKDSDAIQLAEEVESVVEELENSDQILILNKLMDYPILGGYNQLPIEINPKLGYAIAIFIPVGLPVYLLAVYRRKLLRSDIQIVKKTSLELHNMITGE
ncbi:LptF/LptG family permease, partial [Parabacteroides sp. OttesenSCG-928-G21]|nr:LptF/LptG family permease [Parabacteroides sp. OttesenSCG-928-G21]